MNKLEQQFNSMTPRQKTAAEFAGMAIILVVVNLAMWLCVKYNLFFEFFIAALVYCIYTTGRFLYRARVEHWERLEKLNDDYR